MKRILLGLVLLLFGVSGYGVLQMEAAPTSYHTEQVVVMRGDSLWGIARRYGVGLSKLIALNPQIKNPNLIYPGNEVRIP